MKGEGRNRSLMGTIFVAYGEGRRKRVLEYAADRARERDCYKVMLLTGSDEAWKHEFYTVGHK